MTETSTQKKIRGLRRDSREDENVVVVGYETESGQPRAWTGDAEAPYVKPIYGTLRRYSTSAGSLNTLAVVCQTEALLKKIVASNAEDPDAEEEYYLQFFDGPAADATMIDSVPFPKSGVAGFDFGPEGLYCSTGIQIAVSTTFATYTAAGFIAFFLVLYEPLA